MIRVDEARKPTGVLAGAEPEHTVRGFAVATAPAALLVQALERLAERVMEHEADIRVIDPKAEGGCAADN